MALFPECMRWCAFIVLDTADIVRDRDVSSTDKRNEQVEYAGQEKRPDSEIESSRSLNRS